MPQQATLTATRYLNFLLAATTVGAFAMAIITFMPWAVHSETTGFNSSWRWWLLTALSLCAAVLVYLLGHVGTTPDHRDQTFVALLSLTLLWSAGLAISGGAENAANALQLILIAAAFMTLSARHAWVIFTIVVAVQAAFLVAILVPGTFTYGASVHQHAGHNDALMAADHLHYLGMSATFLVAAVLLALVTLRMQRSLRQQQAEIQRAREEQLRQEQILAMGTASSQITHELATPLATISMLYDDLKEMYPTQPLVTELSLPIQQVRGLLQHLRAVSEQIQDQRQQDMRVNDLLTQLKQQVNLNFSLVKVVWRCEPVDKCATVASDLTLVPALLGLLRNAAEAGADESEHNNCIVNSQVTGGHWCLHIQNRTTAQARERLREFQSLGRKAVKSERGLGFGMLLSHATLERFAGTLRIQLDEDGLFHQYILIPLSQTQLHEEP